MTTTPLLGITQLEEDQALPEVVVNEAVATLEGFSGYAVIEDRDLTAPPGSPSDGQRYLVDATATGDWATHDGEIAFYINGAWEFFEPFEGLLAWVKDENDLILYDGAAWIDPTLAAGSIEVLDEGVSETAALVSLDFVGAGVSASDDGSGNVTVTISGGGGGGSGFRGALVKKAADQTTANYTTASALAWDSETGGYDTDTIHDNVTNPSRLSVPSGVSKVRLQAAVSITSSTNDTWNLLEIRKGGSADYVGVGIQRVEIGSTGGYISCATAVVTVTGGTDYFEAFFQTESDTSITIEEERSWFAMEIIE